MRMLKNFKENSIIYLISIIGILLSIISPHVYAIPAQVIIVRHAEEPDKGDDTELSKLGHNRAKALVNGILNHPSLSIYGNPVAIYAQAPKAEGYSIRSIQTVIPLSQWLGIPINTNFVKKDYKEMVENVMDAKTNHGKTVVISWSHEMIGEIASEMGVKDGPVWDKKDFNRYWVIRFNPKGKVFSFDNLPQDLIQGVDYIWN
jgi:hypothetical protein